MHSDKMKIHNIWDEVLFDIREEVGDSLYKAWISKITFIEVTEDRILKLMASSKFIKENVTSRFADVILKVANSYGYDVISVCIDVLDQNNSQITENSDDLKTQSLSKLELQSISKLDKRFTFDDFIVGKPNEFAYAAAMRAAEAETPAFNPLFLYGGVGLGKTHLMHAIAWQIKKIHPQKKVIYLSAEKFMYLFIRALRYKDAMSFKELFRNVDVLMIDDVQFIGGKDTTQEEFFHTFNELVDNNRQVVLSADKSPSDLEGVADRLKSRLGWGLVADIHPTSYELRLGILLAKAKLHKTKIDNMVFEFLASKITSNVRELEGALNRIIAHATLVGREITLEVVNNVLSDVLRSNEKFITIELIQRKVCEFYHVKFSDLSSSKRQKEIAMARQVAMYLSKDMTTLSLPSIGKSFGGKDHSTVIHAVKKIKKNMEEDRTFSADIDILKRSIEG